uniref:Caspase 8 associated protein 2 n=1 Tax=Oreochromis aureus TaxID=47969 RepID=A0A668RDH9_OREAU
MLKVCQKSSCQLFHRAVFVSLQLKSGFRTAQNHIKELRRRLEQLELQNTGLRKENYSLKKNISALLQTARKEVIRKDAEIQRLSQRQYHKTRSKVSERGQHHHYPSSIQNVRDPNLSSHSSTSRLVSPQSHPPPSPPLPPSSNFPPLPKSPPSVDQPPRDARQPMRKESHSLPRGSKASCHSHSKRDSEVTDKQMESDKHKSSHRDHRHPSQQSESIHRRHRSVSDANNDRFHRADKDSVQRCESKSYQRKSYSHDGHRRSDEVKSSPTILETTASSDDKKDGRRHDKAKTAASGPKHSASHSSKESYSRELQKLKTTSSSSRSSNSKDWKKSSVDQHVIRYRDSSKEREGARQRDHQSKGERQYKDEVRRNHINDSQSQTSRKCEKLRTKESSKSDKDRCEKSHTVFKTSPEEANISKKNSEETSPNRKLCFMETLNLTLSPIKKPVLPFGGSLKDPVPVGKDVENGSEEENLQPNMEDMCVIDDIENIELEGELRDITEQSLKNHKVSSFERTLEASDVEDFSSTAVDANSEKLDVNKENKYPGSPAKRDAVNSVDKVSDLNSSRSDTDLEEGEILSESDETAASSPTTATKKAKLAQPVRNKSSPNSVLKKKLAERRAASEESREIAGLTTQSPKSRFKTVCPAASKASFCTIEEIMETFKLVRAEIRKKYMKLHKTFPRKSFYGMMDNFQRSFLEFVDGAHFGKICDQPGELKSRLKKLIESVFGKVSNNGIVKRIFEQQAVDLKQKLWDFVNVQVDYLFVDIHTTLKSFCKASRTLPEDKRSSDGENVSQQPPARKASYESNQAQPASTSLNQAKSCAVVPYKKGLGSRGKDIRITHGSESHPLSSPNTKAEFLLPKNPPATPEKNNIPSLVVTQNGSLLDRTDFELLTEQQASSLTFNLVRDSQMGEIFKCLLQGSDLLESSGIAGENTAWSLGTPRKDGERNISIITPSKFDYQSKLLSPAKFDTPSKLFATWSSISPRKMSSPCSKDQNTLNPALLDENCLLEVPSQNRVLLQANLASQKSYSLLAEDLAVSLTIPSPLKSDSHLSFLQPSTSSMHVTSTPENVISAHICEDALLDGEDATEHDIHLALDTDNSSCGSSSSLPSETLATSFVFKPDMTMQALVMEKSNDHFIVKIRQANPGADSTLTADESLSETLTEEQHIEDNTAAQDSEAGVTEKLEKAVSLAGSFSNVAESSVLCPAGTESSVCLTEVKDLTLLKNQPDDMLTQHTFSKETLKNLSDGSPSDKSLNNISESTVVNESGSKTHFSDENTSPSKTVSHKSQNKLIPSKCAVSGNCQTTESSYTNQRSRELSSHVSDSENNDVDISESERSLVIAEDTSSSPNKGRKRKKYQDKSKAKRLKKEKKSPEVVLPSKEADEDSKSSMGCLSPSSLSAKNVIRKKGEVVMAWTRSVVKCIMFSLSKEYLNRRMNTSYIYSVLV